MLVEPRGVYWARHTKGGRPICYAVDSRGDVVKRYRVTHDSLASAAVASLWNLLDAIDPSPQKPPLRIVRVPSAAQLEYDPYNEPPIAYAPRLV